MLYYYIIIAAFFVKDCDVGFGFGFCFLFFPKLLSFSFLLSIVNNWTLEQNLTTTFFELNLLYFFIHLLVFEFILHDFNFRFCYCLRNFKVFLSFAHNIDKVLRKTCLTLWWANFKAQKFVLLSFKNENENENELTSIVWDNGN